MSSLFMDDEPMFDSAGTGALQGLFNKPASGASGDFSYKPQKQPQTNQPAARQQAADEVFYSDQIFLSKYVSGGFQELGNVGLVFLGSAANRRYKLLLYKSNDEHLYNVDITAAFKGVIQNEVYVAVYDAQNQPWTLRFQSVGHVTAFMRNLALVKAVLQGPTLTSVVIEDVEPGKADGSGAKAGSALVLDYEVYSVTADGKLGARLGGAEKAMMTVGQGEIMRGLDEGVTGMKKGGVRILVVPAQLAYAQMMTSVLVQVTMLKVSKKKADDVDPNASQDGSAMRKMEQFLGPQVGSGAIVQAYPQQGAPAGYYQPPAGYSQSLVVQQPMQPGYGMPGQPMMQQPAPAAAPVAAPVAAAPAVATNDASVLALLLETQKAQGELKMALHMVQSSIGELGVKIEHIDPLKELNKSENKMSGLILLQNIQRLVQENDYLKKDNYEKANRIDQLTDKVSKLLNKNERFIDDSNRMIEDRNDALKETAENARVQLKQILAEKSKAEMALNETMAELAEMTRQMHKFKNERTELRAEIDGVTAELEKLKEDTVALRLKAKEDEVVVEAANKALKEEKASKKVIMTKLESVQDELEEEKRLRAKAEIAAEERKRKQNSEVKRIEELFEEEKKKIEADMDALRETLRMERLTAVAVAQETVARIEAEQEQKWTALMKQQEIAIVNATLMQAQNERADYEKKAHERGRNELLAEKEVAVSRAYMKGQEAGRTEVAGAAGSEDARRLRKQLLALREEAKDRAITQTKTVMNEVYADLKARFQPQETYPGDQVTSTIKGVIKDTTLSLINRPDADEEEEPTTTAEYTEEPEEAAPVAAAEEPVRSTYTAPVSTYTAPAAAAPVEEARAASPEPARESPKPAEDPLSFMAASSSAPKAAESDHEEEPAAAPAPTAASSALPTFEATPVFSATHSTPPPPPAATTTTAAPAAESEESEEETPAAAPTPAPAPVVVKEEPKPTPAAAPAPVKTSAPNPLESMLGSDPFGDSAPAPTPAPAPAPAAKPAARPATKSLFDEDDDMDNPFGAPVKKTPAAKPAAVAAAAFSEDMDWMAPVAPAKKAPAAVLADPDMGWLSTAGSSSPAPAKAAPAAEPAAKASPAAAPAAKKDDLDWMMGGSPF